MVYNTTKERPVQLILPIGRDVKKSNKIVRARVCCDNKSVYTGRILAGLISCIRVDDTQFSDVYNINARDIAGRCDGREYRMIRNACKSLITARAEIDTISNDTGEPGFILINFIEKIEYRNGVISAVFTRSAGTHLLQLKTEFTKYKLIEYLRLSTSYSQRLFEILKSWSGSAEPVIINIDLLQDNMDIPVSIRKNFKNFRTKVLEPAHKEITTKTELRYTWTPLRKGGENSKTGKVYAIRFTIRKPKVEDDSNKELTRKEKQLISKVRECIGRIGYGVCYEDQGDDMCNICRKNNMFTGTKNPRRVSG